jgi:hypothetical protein
MWRDALNGAAGHDVWNLALVEQTAEDIVRHGLTAPVRWLPPGRPFTFLADPFVLADDDGGVSVFAERMDHVTGKGEIWSGRLRPEARRRWLRLRPLLKAEAHLSFPCAFRWQGVDHLLCESWEAGGASLYAREARDWRFVALVRPGDRTVVDAALYEDGDRWWVFCTHPGRKPNAQLYLYHGPTPLGPWQAHPANPVVVDGGRARSGGPLFTTADGLFRPGQDCSTTYGGALVISRVLELTPETYREEPVRRLDPVAPFGDGLHHLCPAGRFTLIDGKARRFNPVGLVGGLLLKNRKQARRAALKARWPSS